MISPWTHSVSAEGHLYATERSYAWSAEMLSEAFGIKLSASRVWQVVEEEGAREQAYIEHQRQ